MISLLTVNILYLNAASTNNHQNASYKNINKICTKIPNKDKEYILLNKIKNYQNKNNQEMVEKQKNKLSAYSNTAPAPILAQYHQKGQFYKLMLIKVMGAGGCKKAIETENKALLLPNMDTNPCPGYWPRVVDEETKMTEYVASKGLLCSKLQKIMVKAKDGDKPIPAYLTDSFNGTLKEKGIFVCDKKEAQRNNAWQSQLFSSKQEREKIENWDEILSDLVTDVAKLVFFNLPTSGDSLNAAVIAHGDYHHIRYFGFDYTSKSGLIEIPEPLKINNLQIKQDAKDKAQKAFEAIIECTFFSEYQNSLCVPSEGLKLINQLWKAYENKIYKEILILSKETNNNSCIIA